MNEEELIARIALLEVNGIGAVHAKKIIETVGSAAEIFKEKKKNIAAIAGIGTVKSDAIFKFDNFKNAEKELKFIESNNIEVLNFDEDNYPESLKNCIDAPLLLFFKGNFSFKDRPKTISIVGTRNITEYGKKICEDFVAEIAQLQILIVSGLAYGVDVNAHKAALKNNLATIGVLAHGLDTLYPSAHKNTAKEMIENGGLISEYPSGTIANKENFPSRNRIVAGMADALLVVETDIKGGSIISAEIAYSYNKDIFCVPGRIGDKYSSGCNKLIQDLKANLVTSGSEILKSMNWITSTKKQKPQKQLFIELSEDEKQIIALFEEKNQLHIDEIMSKTQLTSSRIAGAILNLEMQQVIAVLPGKLYQMV